MEERLQKRCPPRGLLPADGRTYLIAGRVTVNGQTAHLGQRADPDRDEILVDGHPLAPRAEAVYILLNKPRGYVSTLSGRAGAADSGGAGSGLREPGLSVGRLDLDSEGLLLLTNDGAWAQHLFASKARGGKDVSRLRIRTGGRRGGPAGDRHRPGGEPIRPARVEVLRETPGTAVLAVTIHEGRTGRSAGCVPSAA